MRGSCFPGEMMVSSRSCEKCSHLVGESTGFADGLEVYLRKKRVEDGPRDLV